MRSVKADRRHNPITAKSVERISAIFAEMLFQKRDEECKDIINARQNAKMLRNCLFIMYNGGKHIGDKDGSGIHERRHKDLRVSCGK